MSGTISVHYLLYLSFTFSGSVIPPNKPILAAIYDGSRPGVQSASLYDNFHKPGNYVIMTSLMASYFGFKMEIAKKMARENFSIGAFYSITKNQDNPVKTVGRDSFLSRKTPKMQVFRGHPAPRGRTAPIF